MFDVFVDHQKKRYYLLMMIFCVLICGSILYDVLFGLSIFKAEHLGEMFNLLENHPNSYFGYFSYLMITSPALYSNDVLFLVFLLLYHLVASLNYFDWFTILGVAGLIVSHKNKMSKVALGMQVVFLVVRMVFAIGLVLCLYPTLLANNATMAFTRIHWLSLILVVVFGLLFVFIFSYLIYIFKTFYLPLFQEEAD